MPGVAQPNYDQSGGSNNPTRAMAITRQRPAAEQHGRPARRRVADQPVLPADSGLQPQPRGDRNGQRRHQQLRRRSGDGRRRLGKRAGEERHEHAGRIAVRTRHRLPDEGEELLPAGRRSEGHRQRARLWRHGRRAYQAQQGVLFRAASSGRASAPKPATRCRTPAPTDFAAFRRWRCAREFRGHRDGALRPAHRRGERHRASAVRVSRIVRARSPLPVRGSRRATTSRPIASIRFRRTSSASWWRPRCRDSRTTTSRPTATTPTTTSTTARSPGRPARASSSTAGSATPTATRTARRRCRRSTAASTRSSRDASGIRRSTAIRWR